MIYIIYPFGWGIEQRCKDIGMNPEVYFFDNIKDINPAEIEGIIAIGKFGPKQVAELTNINPLVVFVDYSPNEDKFDSIVIDFEKATTKVIDFFIATSHQNIGFIGGRELLKGQANPIVDLRENAFQSYMDAKGLYNDRFVLWVLFPLKMAII